ncbi:MAG: Trk system potassium transporter TrkA [Pseudomonadota bacterium]|jgi:trk system potassium uptake protein TrkA|nr:Trk system potassium transporter TrkA [Pseudomonadota bacterium]
MKIVILGAGQVGTSMAEILSLEANDVTLIDHNPAQLEGLQDRLDIRTVAGSGAHPDVLEQAGIEDAELLLAVTNRDEVNMAACQICYTLYRTPKKIARIRAREYLSHPEIFCNESIPIDFIISPEQIITEQILNLIENPGTLQVVEFAGGRIQLVGVRAYFGGPLVGHELRDLRKHLPMINTRVAAVYRRDRPIIPLGNTVIEPDDEVFFIAAKPHIREVMGELRNIEIPGRHVILAGAGNIGLRLARTLEENGYRVKIIERNPERIREVADLLGDTVVLHGDAADQELLWQENIDQTEVFCAMTNADEANILSGMLAKRLGARHAIALVSRSAYVDLIESSVLDVAISPQLATVGALLTHIRRGDMVAVHSLRRGAAEAIEAIAHGDHSTSQVVGRRIDEIALPPDTTLGAILRRDEVIIARGDTVIEAEDHIIVFVIDKQRIPEVERLFQVAATFI